LADSHQRINLIWPQFIGAHETECFKLFHALERLIGADERIDMVSKVILNIPLRCSQGIVHAVEIVNIRYTGSGHGIALVGLLDGLADTLGGITRHIAALRFEHLEEFIDRVCPAIAVLGDCGEAFRRHVADIRDVVLAERTNGIGQGIMKLDLKEFSRTKRNDEGLWKGFNVELGEGDCDWPSVMKALDAIEYRGWATAEVGGGGRDRLADIAARMDRILQG
jgi:hypothetical protein